jgi:hypothetical protein
LHTLKRVQLLLPFMPIREYFGDAPTFAPAQIKAMSEALREVCAALHIDEGDRQSRETIAERIIDLARTGVVDAVALKERVLREAKSAT